ncbi:hypothetical protein EYF80_022638 [Liparis tanakae]|uniref:Uncharacterized protein n=1 Tax=Liparis tanakae TaxID=230148 RepID=A0A4Z2HMN3_9TELE|nr:hypothetical protein EYF80_022638 [Liparis tanakae]
MNSRVPSPVVENDPKDEMVSSVEIYRLDHDSAPRLQLTFESVRSRVIIPVEIPKELSFGTVATKAGGDRVTRGGGGRESIHLGARAGDNTTPDRLDEDKEERGGFLKLEERTMATTTRVNGVPGGDRRTSDAAAVPAASLHFTGVMKV